MPQVNKDIVKLQLEEDVLLSSFAHGGVVVSMKLDVFVHVLGYSEDRKDVDWCIDRVVDSAGNNIHTDWVSLFSDELIESKLQEAYEEAIEDAIGGFFDEEVCAFEIALMRI